MICRINKEKFNDFMSSLSVREEVYPPPAEPVDVDGYQIHFITIKLDGNSFSGASGVWEEFMNVAFRTNDPASKRKENKEIIEMGD